MGFLKLQLTIILASAFVVRGVLFPGPCPFLVPLNKSGQYYKMEIVYVVPLVESDTHFFREIPEKDLNSDCHVMDIFYFDFLTINLFDYGTDLWVQGIANFMGSNDYNVKAHGSPPEIECPSPTSELIQLGVPQSGYNIFSSCRTLNRNGKIVYDIGLILGVEAEQRIRKDVSFEERKKQFNSLARIQFNLSLEELVKWPENWETEPKLRCREPESDVHYKCPQYEFRKNYNHAQITEYVVLGVFLVIIIVILVLVVIKFVQIYSNESSS